MRSKLTTKALFTTGVRRNAISGLVVGIIALPLSIALAVAVGVPPVAGLYTAAFAGAAAAIFGGSNYNITGPTAALVPILAHLVQVHGVAALPMVGFMAGLILLAMSFVQAGRLMRYMPGLVVVGFTTGIALSIAFGQLNNLLAVSGTDPKLEAFHEKVWDTARHLDTIDATTPALGLASLVVLMVWSRFPRLNRVPGALIAVIVITAITWSAGIDTPTLASSYGHIPREFPSPSLAFFDFGLAIDLLPSALAVAVLGAVESLLSAVVADGMVATAERHDADREIFGQGIANLVSPVMGGIPATAAIARTGAGIRSGATSRLTGVFHALTVLVATLALGGLAGHVPLTVLAAILLIVAWNIAEVPEVVRLLRRAPRDDLVVLVSTMLITLFLDLTYAIGFGVLASAVLLVRRLIRCRRPRSCSRTRRAASGRCRRSSARSCRARPDIAFFTAQGHALVPQRRGVRVRAQRRRPEPAHPSDEGRAPHRHLGPADAGGHHRAPAAARGAHHPHRHPAGHRAGAATGSGSSTASGTRTSSPTPPTRSRRSTRPAVGSHTRTPQNQRRRRAKGRPPHPPLSPLRPKMGRGPSWGMSQTRSSVGSPPPFRARRAPGSPLPYCCARTPSAKRRYVASSLQMRASSASHGRSIS